MTIQQLIAAAEHAARYVPTATAQLIMALVRAVQRGEAQVVRLKGGNRERCPLEYVCRRLTELESLLLVDAAETRSGCFFISVG